MSLPRSELPTTTNWTSLSMSKDNAPTDIHRTMLHAWRYIVRSHVAGHLDAEEYNYAYWMLVHAYNNIDAEYALQESWNI